jgi:hypothetical protein
MPCSSIFFSGHCGDGMKNINQIERAILNSGIFRIEDNQPIGIFDLKADKSLCISIRRCSPHNRTLLRNLIYDSALAIESYLKGPRNINVFPKLLDDFEKEFDEFLRTWSLTISDLDRNCLERLKKRLRKNLQEPAQDIQKSNQKESTRKFILALSIWRVFREYTGIKDTNIFYYVSHLLVACGAENPPFKKVADRIIRQYYRAYQ